MTVYKGQKLRPRSVAMTQEQSIQLTRLGGSAWVRQQLERAQRESTNQSSVASLSNVPMGSAHNGRRS